MKIIITESQSELLTEQVEGLDEFREITLSSYPEVEEYWDVIENFIRLSGVKRIEVEPIRMGVAVSLITGIIFNKNAFFQPLTAFLFTIFHELAHQYQYRKYGKENFTYEKICNGISDRQTLNFIERFWIKVFDSRSPVGYNIEEGGSNKGEVAESTRQKLKNINTGKTIPEETKKKISESMMGSKNHFYGKTHGAEAIKRIVAANIGKTFNHSKESKEKMRQLRLGDKNPMYGKLITEAHRQKLKENAPRNKPWLGKKFSEEHLAKLSIEKTCPHCNKIGKGSAMNRYHMDNCKKAGVI